MTTDVTSLVAGKPAASSTKTATVRVLRPFLYRGKPTAVGETIVDMPLLTALELVQMAKAERVTGTVSVDEVAPTEAEARPRRGRPPKTED